MKKNKIDVIEGTGTLKSATEVDVNGELHQAKNIIIATGARARTLPDVEINGKTVLTYHQALQLTEAPKSLVVIGAGPIGLTCAIEAKKNNLWICKVFLFFFIFLKKIFTKLSSKKIKIKSI